MPEEQEREDVEERRLDEPLGESAYHRLRGKPYDKLRMIRTSTRQALGVLPLMRRLSRR